MKLESEIVKKIIDEVLSDRICQKDIDTLSFFLYPHTSKYRDLYEKKDVDIDVVL